MRYLIAVMLLAVTTNLVGCVRQDHQVGAEVADSSSNTADTADTADTTADADVIAKELAKRRPQYDRALAIIKAVAKKVNDPEVDQVVDFFKANKCLVALKTGNLLPLENGGAASFLLLCPIPSDRGLDPFIDEMMDGDNHAAAFDPGMKLMVLANQDRMSPEWNAVFVLHETFHALSSASAPLPQNRQNVQIFCEEETRAHEFQNRVLSGLGGKSYNDLLNKQVAITKKQVDKSGNAVGVALPECPEYDPQLDTAFGPAKGEYECQARMSQFYIHVLFELIDRYAAGTKPEKEDVKARTLATIYRENGNVE